MKMLGCTLIIVLIVLGFTIFEVHNISAATTALGNLAASMQPGTWAQLTTNNINATLSNPGGASGIIFGYTEYIKWDPVSHRLYYLGGDHATSGTPVMRHVQYDENSNSWSILPEQSWFTAFASHGYDHGAIDPVHRYFYFRPPGNLTMYRWNIDTGVWTAMADNNVIQYDSCCVGIDYFPELHGVIWASDENGDNGGVTLLNETTGQWQRIAKAAAYPMGDYHNFAEYNPVRKVVVFGGGTGGSSTRNIYKLDATGTVTALATAPIDLGIQNAIFTVDPVSGDYLVFTKDNRFYVYNVVTDTWTLRASGSSVPIWTTSYSDAVHGVVAGPIDTYGVNVFVTCDGTNNCKVNLYKHSSGNSSPPPPPPPPNPPPPVTFDFSLSTVANDSVVQGHSTSDNVTAMTTSGTPQSVSFFASGLPSGATGVFSAGSCTPNCTSTLTISAAASTPAGTYPITITGTSGSQSHTTALTLNVNASASTPPPPSSSTAFADKCAQSGVINCFSFDSSSSLYYTWQTGTVCDAAFAGKANYGFGSNREGPGNTAAIVQNGQCVYPQIDTTTSHSGAGSLKFTIPSNSDANSSGFFTEPFKRNSNGTFPYVGPGSPLGNVLYFQFYQKFDTNFVNTDYHCVGGGCGGWKQAIWYGNPPNGASSSSLEVTMNNGWQRNVPQMYGQSGTDDYGVEDAINCTFANATSQGGSGSGANSRPNYQAPLNPTCLHYQVDQWIEFTGRIEIRGTANAPASRVQLWVNGQPAIDYGAARIDWSGGDGNGLGQFLLTPYHTNKDPNQTHPTGYTWYDDLIVSTQPIAMNNGTPTPPPPDTTAPTVSITAPASGTTVSGTSVSVSAAASDNVGVVGVQFKLDGANLGAEKTSAPYSVSWDTTTVSNGTHTLTAVARDAAGNSTTSAAVTVNVSNAPPAPPPDTISPSVSISSPANGSTVSSTITVAAAASDNVGVAGVQFKLDGSNLGAEKTSPPYSLSWNTTTVSNGTHTLTAAARDAAGNSTTSAPVTVNVSNAAPPPPPPPPPPPTSDTTPPVVSIATPIDGSAVSGTVMISSTASDNVGVVGVQLKLDGAALGSELASPPYSMSWNTTKVSNGPHILKAVARDQAGNWTASSVKFRVNNPTRKRPPIQLTTTFNVSGSGGTAFMTTSDSMQLTTDDTVSAATSDPLQIGYAGIQMDTTPSAPSGVAILGVRTGGVVVSETGVPAASTLSSGRVYVNVNGALNTGMAFANSNAEDAVISFYFTDMSGVDFGQGSFTLPANHQLSAFLTQAPFNGRASMEGTFSFYSSVPVGVVAVEGFTNERSDFLFSVLPVASLGDLNSNAIVLPHFADGAGWTTRLILTNPTDDPLAGTVQFFGRGSANQSASPQILSVNGVTSSTFSYVIPPRSAVKFVTGNSTSQVQTGSVRVTPSGNTAPVAVAIFSFRNRGVTVTEASVLAVPTGFVFRTYAEASAGTTPGSGSVQSGIAIANALQTPVPVTIEVTTMDGSSFGQPSTLVIPSGGQVAEFMKELFPSLPANFRGFLKVTAASPIGVIGLRSRYNERGDFLITTTPPRNESEDLPDSDILLPQVVSGGGGYSTEFIIFGQSGSGGLWFNSADGTLMPGSRLRAEQ